jgi:ATP-dependent RNA helicase DeaD
MTKQLNSNDQDSNAIGASETFAFNQLPDWLFENISAMGWAAPMNVQTQAIPLVNAGKDLIVQSKTGSGKTGAFLLPLLSRISQSENKTRALILVPTRELAIQVHHELGLLSKNSKLNSALLYGGVGYGKQMNDLKAGAAIVVGTPGRVLDMLDKGLLNLQMLEYLVMDEADEMLSMGFYPAMRKLKRWMPTRRQSLMFSATMPHSVKNLSNEFLHNQEFLSLSGDNVGVETLEHSYYVVPPMEKDRSLVRLLEMENPANALIFCNRKSDVEYLFQYLTNAGYDVDRISGDLTQRAREKVMSLIRDQSVRFLIATDVAARGIDIKELEIVFQYDVPQDHEIYVHRAGRTARAGNSGRCITLATYMDEFQLKQINKKFKIKIDKYELQSMEKVSERVCERTVVFLEEALRSSGSVGNERSERFLPLARQLQENEDGEQVLAMLLDEFYHRSLHLPPELPKVKTDFDKIPAGDGRKNNSGRNQSRQSSPGKKHASRASKPRESRPKREQANPQNHETKSSGKPGNSDKSE